MSAAKLTTVESGCSSYDMRAFRLQFPHFNRDLSVKGDDGSGAELRITCKLPKVLDILVSTRCHGYNSVRSGTCKLGEVKGIVLDFGRF